MEELLGALGYIGDAINKPGRAIRGLLAGRPDEAAAAIPFSDSLGFTQKSNATSGKDLLNALGMDVGSGIGGDLAGFATEVATDPLTLLGAGAGARLGGAAERAAVAAGPRYGTTADDLSRMLSGSMTGDMVESKILAHPQANRLLSEINPESQLIGNGVEALAFKEPNGTVTRIGEMLPGAPGRPISPNVAQAESAMNFPGGPMSFRVERGIPYADRVNDIGFWTKRNPETMLDPTTELNQALQSQGLRRQDRHFGNVGMIDDTPMVIDPGDIRSLPGFSGGFQEVAQAREPGMMMNALLNALGSSQTIQAGLDPRYRALLGVGGGGAGATSGAFGRAFGQ